MTKGRHKYRIFYITHPVFVDSFNDSAVPTDQIPSHWPTTTQSMFYVIRYGIRVGVRYVLCGRI